MEQQKTAAFTGHRPQSLPWGRNEKSPRCVEFKKILKAEIEKAIAEGYTAFVTGMEMGVDLIAGRIVIDLKEIYPHITLECAIPFEAQAALWPEEEQEKYRYILSRCDHTNIICPRETKGAYGRRNRYMVGKAGLIIAGWSGVTSGTGNTVRYARKKGRRLVIIDPVGMIINREGSVYIDPDVG